MAHAQKPDFVFRAKRTSPFKSARWWGVSSVDCWPAEVSGISGINSGYTMFRGSAKSTGYPLHSPVSPTFTSPPVRRRVPSHFNWSLPVITLCSYFKQTWNFSSDIFTKNIQISNFIKIVSVAALLSKVDGQIDTTKLTVTVRNFAQSPASST